MHMAGQGVDKDQYHYGPPHAFYGMVCYAYTSIPGFKTKQQKTYTKQLLNLKDLKKPGKSTKQPLDMYSPEVHM